MKVLEELVQLVQMVARAENVVLLIINLLVPALPNQPKKGADCPFSQGDSLLECKVMLGGGKGAVEPCQRKEGEPLV